MLESKKGKGGDREQGRVPGRLHRVRSLASELLPMVLPVQSRAFSGPLGYKTSGAWHLPPPVKPSVKGCVFLKSLPWVACFLRTLCPGGDLSPHRPRWLMEVWTRTQEVCIPLQYGSTLCDSYILGLSNSSTESDIAPHLPDGPPACPGAR